MSQSMDPVANVAGAPGGTAGSQAASVVCPNCQVTPETVDPGWKPIRLRFVGTEERVACAFADCRHPIAPSGAMLEGMPADRWIDAICQFAIFE